MGLLSLAMAMVDMATVAMVTAMDTTATMARGRLRQLLLLSQKLLLSLATDTTAMVATEAMAMADMVTTATMARGPLMLRPTTATEDMEDMVMDTATDMATRMPTTATEDTVDMVMIRSWIRPWLRSWIRILRI